MRVLSLTALLVVALMSASLAEDALPAAKVKPGRETTYFAGPLDKSGGIDYVAALNESLRGKITPEQNANVLLIQALGPAPEKGTGFPPSYFRWLQIPAPPAQGNYFIMLPHHLSQWQNAAPVESQRYLEQQIAASRMPWKATDFPRIAAWLQANERPLAVILEASRRPQFFNPLAPPADEGPNSALTAALLSNVQVCREVVRALAARAMLRASEKKLDESWDDLLAAHRLARLMGRGGSLIEILTGIAFERIVGEASVAHIENPALTSKQIRRRLQDLQELPPMPSMAEKVDLTERVIYLDLLQRFRRGEFEVFEPFLTQKPGKLTAEQKQALADVDGEALSRSGNEWYDKMVAVLRQPDRYARQKANEALMKALKGQKRLPVQADDPFSVNRVLSGNLTPAIRTETIGIVLIRLFLPATFEAQAAHDRVIQHQLNLQVAFALAAYRRDHGRSPARLSELAPEYLKTIPGDLFSGKDLKYRSTPEGYLLYSVGENEEDDRGHGYDDTPEGDDLRIRVPAAVAKAK